jgi:intein-encoded DNA endonuclease-like protein
MPCDQIQTTEVDIGKLDPGLAGKALVAMELDGRVSYDQRAGTLIVRGNVPQQDTLEARFKQHYSAQVIKETAAKNRWTLKEVAPFQYEVIK